MSASKRPSTSSLRRYLTSRPYVAITDLRRRFNLDPEAMSHIARNGTSAFVGLPEREALKVQDLWERGEIGIELSVEVRAPVIVGVYPMHIARYVVEHSMQGNGNGQHAPEPAATLDADPGPGMSPLEGPVEPDAPTARPTPSA